MIDLTMVVWMIVYIIGAAAVFGLLYVLVNYVEKEFPSEMMTLFAKVARVALMVLAILVIIGIILSLMTGTPLFRWGGSGPRVGY